MRAMNGHQTHHMHVGGLASFGCSKECIDSLPQSNQQHLSGPLIVSRANMLLLGGKYVSGNI